jgi:hypothetical protein
MILSPLHGVLHIQSACDSVAPFFSFIGYPVCSNKHFQIIVTINKKGKKERNFCERNGKETKKSFDVRRGERLSANLSKPAPFIDCVDFIYLFIIFSLLPLFLFCFVLPSLLI